MSTQSLTAAALSCGFVVRDFEKMTIGMLMDVVSEFITEKDRVYIATQDDINKYL